MPYTNAQLSGYYQSLTGAAPTGADAVLINAYATQSQNGTLSDNNALLGVFNSAGVQATFEVAESTYQFFTGSGVSQAGLNFLEGNAGSGNAQGLNTSYYTAFNTENRYYNFAINLASSGGAGNTNFVSTYANLTFAQTVATAYETIVGSSNVGTAAANAAIADITSRQAFFTSVAQTRAGGVDAGGAAGQNIALKAVVIGYILEEANKADVGTYAKAIDQLEAAVAAQGAGAGVNNPFSSNIVQTFGASGSGFNSGFAALGANNNAQTNFTLTTGIDAPNLTTGSVQYIGTVNNSASGSNTVNPSTLQAGDSIRATGANNTLTVTTIGAPGGGAVDATGGAVISGVQTINVRAVADQSNGAAAGAGATFNAQGTAGGGQGNVTGTTALNAYLTNAPVAFTNVSTQSVGIINDGLTTGGTLTATYVASATSATVNLAGGTTAGETVTLNGSGLKTINVNSNGGLNSLGGGAGAATGITVQNGAGAASTTATDLVLSATSALTLSGINDAVLTNLTASGTSTINAGTINAALTKIDTTALTGAFTATFTAAPTATTTYSLGSGADNLTFGTAAANVNLAAGTNVNLGQGINSFVVNGSVGNNGAATPTSSIIGGTQGDTIRVTGTIGAGVTINSGGGGDTVQVGIVTPGATVNGGGNATFLTGQADFTAISNTTAAATFTAVQRGQITGFTTVGITDALAAGATYDVNAIGAQNFTTIGVAGGGTANLNANTGAIVTFTSAIAGGAAAAANLGTLNVGLANSATNANDILNLGYANLPTAGNVTSNVNVAATAAGAGVETINVVTSGTTTNAFNVQLGLVDVALTNISFAGNEGVNYAPVAAHTVLKSINASAMSGTATFDVSLLPTTNGAGVAVTTGSGNDNVFVRDFAQITTGSVAGGAPAVGNANFNTVTVGVTTSGQTYSTVLDAKAGDHITFGTVASDTAAHAVSAVSATKIVLNATTAVFQDYLDAATASTVAPGTISAFDFGGNTYLVEQNGPAGAGNTFQNGTDSVIKLVGIHTIDATSTAATGAILGS